MSYYSPWYKIQRDIDRREIDKRYKNNEDKGTTFAGTPVISSLSKKQEKPMVRKRIKKVIKK